MNNFTLIHSFHFLNKQNYSLCTKTYNIVDKNNKKLCGLLNIPNHKKLYTPKLVKLIANPFHNLKIVIEINYDYLYKLILTKSYIHNKKDFIKLLKKKYWCNNCKNSITDGISYNKLDLLDYDKNEYIKKNCIQIKDIIINLETEEFFILNSLNRSEFFLKNKGIQAIFYSKPDKNLIHQLSDCTILKSIFKNNTNIIITSDSNKQFLKVLNEIKIVKKKDLLNNNYKFTVIYEKFYENNSVEINSIKWNSVIFLNIESEENFNNYQNIQSDNKFIFFNSLKNHNFINQHFNYFQLLINPKLCFLNKENLCKLKNKIYYLKQKDLKFKKKQFTLQPVDKNFINEIDYNNLELFYSLKENFMYYSLIDFSIFKENKFLKDKIYDNNKYKNPECVICLNNINKNSLLYTVCNHYFCENCIITHFKHNPKLCPLCRKEIDSGSLLKIRYNKKTNYASNKLKYILSLKNDDVLIISYFSKSIQKLRHILENYSHTNKYTLLNINSIEKLHTLDKSTQFSKILFLEDHGEHFNYYQYYINSFKFIQKKNINILAIKN